MAYHELLMCRTLYCVIDDCEEGAYQQYHSVAASLTYLSTPSNLAFESSELGILLIRSLRDSRYARRVSSSDTSLQVSNVVWGAAS